MKYQGPVEMLKVEDVIIPIVEDKETGEAEIADIAEEENVETLYVRAIQGRGESNFGFIN
jgi:hypothetical protein